MKNANKIHTKRLICGGLLCFIVAVIYCVNSGYTAIFNWIGVIPYGDKFGHFFLFGLLTYSASAAIEHRTIVLRRFTLPVVTLPLLLIITLEELSQGWIASRTLDAFDLLTNILGVGVFSWLALKSRHSKTKKQSARNASLF